MLQILHNPRCGKSRVCLAFVTKSEVPFEVIHYLKNPLTVTELKVLLRKLKIKPIELVRQKEQLWIENYKEKAMTGTAILKALSKDPILMQRPVIIGGNKAVIGSEINKIKNFI